MVKSHLYPRGAVILKGEEATCIGVLNFSDDEIKKISPVFFTPESLKGEVQLYFPTRNNNEGRTEVDASLDDSVKSPQVASEASSSSDPVVRGYSSTRQMLSAQPTLSQNQATERDNPDEGSSNDDHTVYPDDNTLQEWQKLCTEKTDECAALKQQSERDQQTISLLEKHNSELRSDIKKTEQQNQELRTEIEELEDLRKENEDLRTENKTLRVENKGLRKERQRESKELREDNRQLRTENKELREDNRQLRTETKELRAESKELHAENKESREKWSAERNELRAENEELRAENEELRAENDELRAKNGEWPGKLKELLCEKDSAAKVFEEGTSSSEGSKDVNASGSSANNKQGDSDGSCKEEPFFDPVSEDVSKLD